MTAGRDADELTQDVFVRVWQNSGSFRGDSAFGTQLHRLAVNVVIERFRTESTRRQRHYDGEEIFASLPAAPTRSGDLAMDFEAALAKLPDGAREIFVLHDVEAQASRRSPRCWIFRPAPRSAAPPGKNDPAQAPRSGMTNMGNETIHDNAPTVCRTTSTRSSRPANRRRSSDISRNAGRAAPSSTSCGGCGSRGIARGSRSRRRSVAGYCGAHRCGGSLASRDSSRAPAGAFVYAPATRGRRDCSDGAVGRRGLARTNGASADFRRSSARDTTAPPSRRRRGAADRVDIAPVMMADAQFVGAVEDLERVLEAGRNRLDPKPSASSNRISPRSMRRSKAVAAGAPERPGQHVPEQPSRGATAKTGAAPPRTTRLTAGS